VPRFISVELPKNAYFMGDVIEGAVVLETTKDTPSRGLYVDFTGKEETQITRSSGKQTVTYRSEATLVTWRLPLQGEATIGPGTYRFPFKFQIPLQGLPSYLGRALELTGARAVGFEHEPPTNSLRHRYRLEWETGS